MTTSNTALPHTPADRAEELLAAAADKTREPFGKLPHQGQDAAIQGTGYALLAIASQLAANNSTLTGLSDTVTDIAAHLEQLTITADEMASGPAPARRGRWTWRRRTPKPEPGPGSCTHCGASGEDVELWVTSGISECMNIRACLARRAGQAVLSADDAATVRRALADAVKWRTVALAPSGACGCGEHREDAQCPDHASDAATVTAYAALADRLAPSGTEVPA
jgi:hypothetical protein